MNKIAIVFWSGTGNTETMAECIAAGAREAGAEVDVLGPDDFSADKAGAYDVLAFGCSSQGSEQLEESSFEPMFAG
ncbi:MAG: flavodoxin domain-containing protein, partial [Oscillibacter sp.]|nr:flavodoxin domain-containing protein [Oscillibacter sp.]